MLPAVPHLQSGLTPLHLAAQEDRVNVAEVLVNQGAAVDAQTKVWMPLYCFLSWRQKPVNWSSNQFQSETEKIAVKHSL